MTTDQEFVERTTAAAADLGLAFVGTPEGKMQSALNRVRSNLEAQLKEPFGADLAAAMAQAFVTAVAGHKAEIEGGTSTRSAVLQ
jgi:hypothetical protein